MSLLLLFAGAGHQASKAPVSTTKKGWFNEWDKKRRIPLELFREILEAQNNPWAKELADTYEKIEARLASPVVVSQRRRKKLIKETEKILQSRPPTFNWAPIIAEILRLLQEDDDDEEDVILLWMKLN